MLVVKDPPANARDIRDAGLIPGLGREVGEDRITGEHFRVTSLFPGPLKRQRGAAWEMTHRHQ